jgi:hypothetical protein
MKKEILEKGFSLAELLKLFGLVSAFWLVAGEFHGLGSKISHNTADIVEVKGDIDILRGVQHDLDIRTTKLDMKCIE